MGFGSRLISPAPLMAAVLNPGGVGGRSTKCCSKVGFADVPSAPLSSCPTLRSPMCKVGKYFARAGPGNSRRIGSQRRRITLGAVNNNGTKPIIGANNCPKRPAHLRERSL